MILEQEKIAKTLSFAKW